MELDSINNVLTDVLVIGGGGAGLRAAIEARKSGASVLIVSKTRVGYGCNTAISAGGIAAAVGDTDNRDNSQIHLQDTLAAGHFVNDYILAEVVSSDIPRELDNLSKFGVLFMKEAGRTYVGLTPGHTYPRNVRGERSFGQDFTLPLHNYALGIGVKIAEGMSISHLLESSGRVVGAIGVDRRGQIIILQSKAVILAAGGAGQLYMNTDNYGGATGDGYALAYDLGLSLQDMEFVQFYPTALGRLGKMLISYEMLVFRWGATLRNSLGEDILDKYDLKDPVQARRDKIAQAVFLEVLEGRSVGGGVLMDLTTIPEDRVVTGLPPWIPKDRENFIVAPTSHFFMGGVKINHQAETEREGLWAAGEVCSGVHGANRLGGNALAEVFVFGSIAGKQAAAQAAKVPQAAVPPGQLGEALADLKSLVASSGKESEKEMRQELKKIMWLNAGIIREKYRLENALGKLSALKHVMHLVATKDARELQRVLELRSRLIVSEMVCRASLAREESRGCHFRSDFPRENNSEWLKNILITRCGDNMQLSLRPVKPYR
jgi:succinate dehydrogenase/fumarate reductase flavoprotein subunit